MDATEMRHRVTQARSGRLSTVSATGRPHLVPICFAVLGERIVHAVDGKPKRSLQLRRTANIRATGVAALLVDHYDDDWTQLWWVRVDGVARVVEDVAERSAALLALAVKYPQYRDNPPAGDVLCLDVERWAGWSWTS